MENVSMQLITKMIKENSVRSELKQKLEDSLTFFNLNASLNGLKISSGTDYLQPAAFTFDEREEVRQLLAEEFSKHVETIKDNKSKTIITEQVLFEAREELHSALIAYGDNLVSYNNMLEEMRKTRMETLPEMCSSKLIDTKQQYQLLKAKLTLLNYTTQVQIFKENSCSLEAYRELIGELQKMQDVYEKDIEELQQLQATYDAVDCEEYREILKEYLHYTNAIERKLKFNEAIKDV